MLLQILSVLGTISAYCIGNFLVNTMSRLEVSAVIGKWIWRKIFELEKNHFVLLDCWLLSTPDHSSDKWRFWWLVYVIWFIAFDFKESLVHMKKQSREKWIVSSNLELLGRIKSRKVIGSRDFLKQYSHGYLWQKPSRQYTDTVSVSLGKFFC